jgi:hypothetical protein
MGKYHWGKTATVRKHIPWGAIVQNKIIFVSTMAVFLWFLQLSVGCGYIVSYLHAKVIFFFLETGCYIFDSSKRFM